MKKLSEYYLEMQGKENVSRTSLDGTASFGACEGCVFFEPAEPQCMKRMDVMTDNLYRNMTMPDKLISAWLSQPQMGNDCNIFIRRVDPEEEDENTKRIGTPSNG